MIKCVTDMPFGFCDDCDREAQLTPGTSNYPAIDELICAECYHGRNCGHLSWWDRSAIHYPAWKRRHDYAREHPVYPRMLVYGTRWRSESIDDIILNPRGATVTPISEPMIAEDQQW